MALRPNSTVKLYYGVDIDNDERIAWSSAALREAYFQRHLLDTFENVQAIKKENETNNVDIPNLHSSHAVASRIYRLFE